MASRRQSRPSRPSGTSGTSGTSDAAAMPKSTKSIMTKIPRIELVSPDELVFSYDPANNTSVKRQALLVDQTLRFMTGEAVPEDALEEHKTRAVEMRAKQTERLVKYNSCTHNFAAWLLDSLLECGTPTDAPYVVGFACGMPVKQTPERPTELFPSVVTLDSVYWGGMNKDGVRLDPTECSDSYPVGILLRGLPKLKIPDEDEKVLKELGGWTSVNGVRSRGARTAVDWLNVMMAANEHTRTWNARYRYVSESEMYVDIVFGGHDSEAMKIYLRTVTKRGGSKPKMTARDALEMARKMAVK